MYEHRNGYAPYDYGGAPPQTRPADQDNFVPGVPVVQVEEVPEPGYVPPPPQPPQQEIHEVIMPFTEESITLPEVVAQKKITLPPEKPITDRPPERGDINGDYGDWENEKDETEQDKDDGDDDDNEDYKDNEDNDAR